MDKSKKNVNYPRTKVRGFNVHIFETTNFVLKQEAFNHEVFCNYFLKMVEKDKLMNDAEISIELSPVKSFKDFMYNTILGRSLIAMGIGGGLFIGYQLVDNYLIKKPEPVVQQQVFGTDKPEIYIERNGVKYFSHVDGREISDLVNP